MEYVILQRRRKAAWNTRSCSVDAEQSGFTKVILCSIQECTSPPSRNDPRVYGCAKSRVSSQNRAKWDGCTTANCTTSFPPSGDIQIRYAHPILLNCHQLYIGCPEESPWLARRIKLKMYASFLPLNCASIVAAETRIQRCLCGKVNEIWQYRTSGNLTTFDKDYGALEEGRSQSSELNVGVDYSIRCHGQI